MFKKVVLTLVALVLLIVVGAVVAVKVLVTEEKIINAVVPHIEKALGREVEVIGAKAMVFPYLGAEITGLKIANTDREGFRTDEPFVGLEKFQMKVEFMPLLKKEVIIDAIILKNADILVEVDSDGSFNYSDLAVMPDPNDTTPKAPKEKKEGEPLQIPVKMNAFIIEDARIRYFDAKGGHSVVLGKINDRTDFTMDASMKKMKTTGELTITEMSVKTGTVPTPLTGLTLTFNHDIDVDMSAEKVAINAITASFQKIGIKLTGEITEFASDAKLDLELNSDKVMIQDIINEIPRSLSPEISKIAAQGHMALKLDVGGVASKPAIDGMLSVKDGKIHYTELPQSINDINASIQFTENDLDIQKLALKLGKNPIELMAKVSNFADPSINAKLEAKLNLDDMREMLSLPDGFTVGGRIDAGIRAKGKVDPTKPEALDIQGSVAVMDLKAKTTDFTAPIQVDGKMVFTPAEIQEDVVIKIADSDMAIKASLKNYLSMILPERGGEKTSLSMTLNSKMLNTNGFLVKKEAPAEVTSTETAPSAEKTPKPVLEEPLPNIDVDIRTKIGTLKYDQITLTNINSVVTLVNQLFKVDGSANIYGGSTKLGLSFDAANLNDVKTAIDFDVNKVRIDELVSSFNDQLKENRPLSKELKKLDGVITGAVTLKSKFMTNGKTDENMTQNLAGTIHADVSEGKISGGTVIEAISGGLKKFVDVKEISFRKVKFDARIDDEKLFIDTLDISSPRLGDWMTYGAIGFDATLGLTLETRLTKKLSAPIVGAQSKGKEAASSLVNKYLGGTVVESVAQGQIDKRGISVDSEGRVTPYFVIGGTAGKPKVKPKGFKQHKGSEQTSQTSPKQDLQAAAKKQAEALKNKAEAELKAQQEKLKREADAAKKKAEEAKKKAIDDAKRKADAAKKKAEEEAKKAEDKLKKVIKKPNFKF